WKPREPVIQEIVTFARQQLKWDEEAVKKRFLTIVWPGIGFRMISSVCSHRLHFHRIGSSL
ncbi:hypothetical protein R3P38DRAFT_2578131, partial [Favolaschia claudopus]